MKLPGWLQPRTLYPGRYGELTTQRCTSWCIHLSLSLSSSHSIAPRLATKLNRFIHTRVFHSLPGCVGRYRPHQTYTILFLLRVLPTDMYFQTDGSSAYWFRSKSVGLDRSAVKINWNNSILNKHPCATAFYTVVQRQVTLHGHKHLSAFGTDRLFIYRSRAKLTSQNR